MTIFKYQQDFNNKISLREFRRLRNYYRRHYEAGYNDAIFCTWIQVMIDKDRKEKGLKPIYNEEEIGD